MLKTGAGPILAGVGGCTNTRQHFSTPRQVRGMLIGLVEWSMLLKCLMNFSRSSSLLIGHQLHSDMWRFEKSLKTISFEGTQPLYQRYKSWRREEETYVSFNKLFFHSNSSNKNLSLVEEMWKLERRFGFYDNSYHCREWWGSQQADKLNRGDSSLVPAVVKGQRVDQKSTIFELLMTNKNSPLSPNGENRRHSWMYMTAELHCIAWPVMTGFYIQRLQAREAHFSVFRAHEIPWHCQPSK